MFHSSRRLSLALLLGAGQIQTAVLGAGAGVAGFPADMIPAHVGVALPEVVAADITLPVWGASQVVSTRYRSPPNWMMFPTWPTPPAMPNTTSQRMSTASVRFF